MVYIDSILGWDFHLDEEVDLNLEEVVCYPQVFEKNMIHSVRVVYCRALVADNVVVAVVVVAVVQYLSLVGDSLGHFGPVQGVLIAAC